HRRRQSRNFAAKRHSHRHRTRDYPRGRLPGPAVCRAVRLFRGRRTATFAFRGEGENPPRRRNVLTAKGLNPEAVGGAWRNHAARRSRGVSVLSALWTSACARMSMGPERAEERSTSAAEPPETNRCPGCSWKQSGFWWMAACAPGRKKSISNRRQ